MEGRESGNVLEFQKIIFGNGLATYDCFKIDKLYYVDTKMK